MPAHRPAPATARGIAFRAAEAQAVGLTPGQIRHRSVQRPFRGVRSIDLPLDTVLDRCRAYLPALAETAVFSHETAAAVYGLPLWTAMRHGPLHVTSTVPTRPRIPGIVGHREQNLLIREHLGLRLAAPQDTWCQLAPRMRLPDLVAIGDALLTGGRIRGGRTTPLCTADDLREAIARRSPARGTVLLREALPLVRAGVDSPQETQLRLTLTGAGFAEPDIGPTALWPDGSPVLVNGHRVHPDLGYPTRRIAFEYEGDHHRTDRDQWQQDLARVRALEAAGWLVLRVTASDLANPEYLFRALRAALAARSTAPSGQFRSSLGVKVNRN
ncbi:MAG: hypothetical protein ACQEW8_09870 [Actinomycetota bacterium]